MRGRVPVGYAASGGHPDVSTLGNNDGQAAANRRPKHRTSISDPGHTHSFTAFLTNAGAQGPASAPPGCSSQGGTTGSATTGITAGTGNTNDALDTPSYLVLNYIIKT